MTTTIEKPTGRPKKGYFLSDGKTRVPGATTITGRFKDSGGLVIWANQIGLEGLTVAEIKNDAADTGTCGHDMVHADLLGLEKTDLSGYTLPQIQRAEHAFLAYLDWKQGRNIKVVMAETPMVSERYRFGGTPDLYAEFGNKLVVIDLKTSNGIYSDMLIQVAGAYSLLWEEHHPDKPLHGMDLLRISKPKAEDDPVSFEHRHFSAEIFPICQKQFLLLREAYDLDKRIKGFV